jgi:hypothetical protein
MFMMVRSVATSHKCTTSRLILCFGCFRLDEGGDNFTHEGTQHFMQACAGAFSGTGQTEQSSDTLSHAESERAHRADMITIRMAGSYSECMAKDVPWKPQESSIPSCECGFLSQGRRRCRTRGALKMISERMMASNCSWSFLHSSESKPNFHSVRL